MSSGESLLNIESLSEQIPYYLTSEQKVGLAKALSDFPHNTRYYLSKSRCPELQSSLLQGDIFKSLKIFNEDGDFKEVKGIIISNSCDIDCNNQRDLPARALFSPLISLNKYGALLARHGKSEDAINEKLSAIKEQRITNIVYLPATDSMEESIALLDDIHQLTAKKLKEHLDGSNKEFTLSQVGFYILLFKLSIHFCRFHENVARYESSSKP
ncbi:Uncharacterised protein [Serratia quinivorans]|uniref:hypothetical protein n=1 Tax=Serratia quinivorans TaxID=137545 RepID=UPI00217B8984|nr:hypothetical protein [Serratia quinivorans]CAI0837445.1 Uncharacterised protein [Serratia quinivorans]